MSDQLKPCPFCGGKAELWRAHAERTAWIACMSKCSVLVSKEHKTDAEAIAAWNHREIPAAQPSPDVAAHKSEDVAAKFDNADWYWRAMDPDDCGNSPEEAVNRGMLGRFRVCEIASSYTGPTRYGFIAPALDPESDDEEFVHFSTHEEAMEAAKARAAIARVKGGE